MATPVNTIAAGGIAVVDVTATLPKTGAPVSEALPGMGAAVTKVANYGVPVTYVGATGLAVGTARQSAAGGVMVNSDGTARQADASGVVMINL